VGTYQYIFICAWIDSTKTTENPQEAQMLADKPPTQPTNTTYPPVQPVGTYQPYGQQGAAPPFQPGAPQPYSYPPAGTPVQTVSVVPGGMYPQAVIGMKVLPPRTAPLPGQGEMLLSVLF